LFISDPDPDFYPSLIPDPEVKKSTGSRIRIRNTAFYTAFMPGRTTLYGSGDNYILLRLRGRDAAASAAHIENAWVNYSNELMRLAKAQLPPSVQLKKLNQKCRILRPKSKTKRSDVTVNGGGGDNSNGGAFIFLNVQFCDVAATNASLAGSRDAVIPALELPAAFRLATFTALRDKATAAVPQLLSMDLWLDQRVGGKVPFKF
jgi:hypothetical protein